MQKRLLAGLSTEDLPFYNQQTGESLPVATEYVDEQQFDSQGRPIPISERMLALEAVPKSMDPVYDSMDPVHAANDIGQQLKDAWLKGASGMLNSKKEPKKRHFSGHPTASMEQPKAKKPGWMMAEGTNYWVVNTEDPHWDTQEGYDEAIALYGESPAWSTMPVQPKKMLNINSRNVAANLKKYF